MSINIFYAVFLVGNYIIISPSLSYQLHETDLAILTQLQTSHYEQVKKAVDITDKLSNKLFFVDDNLKATAQQYLENLAEDELQQLAPLKESCEDNEACLTCFDGENQISEISWNTTQDLVAFLDGQKDEFNDTIIDIKQNLVASALISTEVYEKFKNSIDFDTDATNYYERIRKALEYETDLYEKTINDTMDKIINHYIKATVEANDKLKNIFNVIVECADQALNPN